MKLTQQNLFVNIPARSYPPVFHLEHDEIYTEEDEAKAAQLSGEKTVNLEDAFGLFYVNIHDDA